MRFVYKCACAVVVLALTGLATACQAVQSPAPAASATAAAPAAPQADLGGIKRFLVSQAQALKDSAAELDARSQDYYSLAKSANFDYAALWSTRSAEAMQAITAVRDAWMKASPLYEKMEGIVGGTPALAEFDVILDAGSSAAEDPATAVPFDLTLPDGRVLPKPGNLFGVTESTLWGTFPAFAAQGVQADWNNDGALAFGETLPDANVLAAATAALDSNAAKLLEAAQQWEPTPTDAFTALIVMTPTMSELFSSWRDSRFVAGEASQQRDFAVISRLADITDILAGLEVIYGELQPLVNAVDSEQAAQVASGLSDLRAFVADVRSQEEAGKRFSPEEADLLGAEAQDQAATITGQLSQLAAQLQITIAE